MHSLDAIRLQKLMSIYTPISSICSLPYITHNGAELKIRWFIYDMEAKENKHILHIKRICTLDTMGRVDIILPNNKTYTLTKTTTHNAFNEIDYIRDFIEAFEAKDEEKIHALLLDAESKESAKVYKDIAVYVE